MYKRSESICILILCPFEPVRSILRRLVESIDHGIVVKEASDPAGITAVIKECCPALLFMSLPSPTDGGIHRAEQIKSDFPGMTLVVMTRYDYPEYATISSTSNIDCFIAEETMGRRGIECIIEEARAGCRQRGSPSIP